MRRYGWAAWKGHEEKWAELVREARSAEFDYVELSLDYPLIYERERVKKMIEVLREVGMSHAFHAPWRGVELASPLEEIREASVEVIKRAIDLASETGAEYVVYHVTTSEKLMPDVKEAVIKAGKKSVEELHSYASERGVTLALENVGTLGHPDFFGELRDETEARFCFDFAHAVTSFMHRHKLKLDDVNVDDVIELWANTIGGRVVCAHIHGIESPRRSHKPLVYPITKRAAAKAYVMVDADYVTFEIYYTRGNREATPSFVGREMKEVKSWEKVYRRPKAL